MKVPLNELKQTTLAVLARSGYPPDEAQTILDVLMYAQLRGNNQGVVKLIGAGMPRSKEAQPIKTVKETKLSALLDGGRNSGMVAMKHAVQLALTKTREHGFGIIGTHNTKSSTGAIGYYANWIAQEGFIGFIFSGSAEYVAMHGSYQPLFGTNPLAIGLPTNGAPLVFDMATSAIAWFGLVEAKTAGRAIPADVAYDAQGSATTDPAAALGGAIRTFGGYKGAALSLIVEILTHELVETKHNADGKKDDWGNLVFVIDPELLTDSASFRERVDALLQRAKASKKLPGVDEILIPGERGNRFLDEITRTGLVEIEEKLWTELQKAAS
ncbi:MAG: Ldh family oxidoreductase [Anaerolineae bacterium]